MPSRGSSRRASQATIHEGDCLKVLQGFESECVDSIVTDPPAGIGFMGKEWDTPGALVERRPRKGETWDAVGGNHHPADNKDKYRTLRVEGAKFRAFLTPIFEECYRVLKPGGHAVIWALPRTSHWTGTSIEDAGFEVRDVVTHHLGQGFPKSLDVSKAIDRAAGAEREVVGERVVRGIQPGQNKMVGTPVEDKPAPVTVPKTPAAQRWAGWGTALKPATEFWFLARKPLNGTVAANVLAHGTGALNIEGCRIPFEPTGNAGTNPLLRAIAGCRPRKVKRPFTSDPTGDNSQVSSLGRWPANLILSHAPTCTTGECAPSCAVAEIDAQSGVRSAGHFPKNTGQSPMWGGEGGGLNGRERVERYTEPGGASRFFYVAKPTRRERDLGLDGFPTQTADAYAEHRGRRMSEPSRIDGKPPAQGRNTHPTVKPIELMRYLLRLVTPPGGIALDPFAGSGTTGCAAITEGFRFIGIERESAYVRIARRRIAAAGRER